MRAFRNLCLFALIFAAITLLVPSGDVPLLTTGVSAQGAGAAPQNPGPPAGRGQPGVWLRSPATGLPSMRIAQTGDPFAQLFAAAFAPAGHRLAVIGLSSAQILCLP